MDDAAAPKHELEVCAAAGTLTFQQRQLIQRAKALRDGMKQGKPVATIATELGDVSRSVLSRYLGSELYHAALRASEVVPAERKLTEDEAIELARKTLANTLPEAMGFIAHAFRRDEDKPARPYVDEGLAQWATALLLKASGLADPANNGGAKAPIVITADAMHVMLGAIRGDDKKREALPLPSVTATADVVRE